MSYPRQHDNLAAAERFFAWRRQYPDAIRVGDTWYQSGDENMLGSWNRYQPQWIATIELDLNHEPLVGFVIESRFV